MRIRPRRVAGIALLLAVAVSALVYHSWISAQVRAVGVLVTVLDVPLARHLVEAVTDEPRVTDMPVAGTPTTIVRPGGGDGPWPALVFVNGATRRGRHHPDVQRLARALARFGYVVLVPDVFGLTRGEISRRTLASTVTVAWAVTERPDVRGGKVAFAGVSVGATLALLAAEDTRLADRVSLVAGIAPYADLRGIVRLATTGRYEQRGTLVSFAADDFLSQVIARSLVTGLTPGADRNALREHLLAVDDDASDPLAGLRRWRRHELGADGSALVELLANQDPGRFDRLYKDLPAAIRAGVERLSPIHMAGRLRARVELASAPKDKYFPLAESEALVARATHGRLTVTETLDHAVPGISLHEIGDLFRFYGFIVRSLRQAAAGGGS